MFVWVTEELVRWALRRSLWQQRGLLQVVTSVRGTQPLTPFCSSRPCSRQSQTLLAGNLWSPVRYYSHKLHSEGMEENVQQLPIARVTLSPFQKKLQVCGSPTDVLDLSTQYALSHYQVNSCLTHMWVITRRLSGEQRKYELQLMFQHPRFDELLLMAIKDAGHMESKHLIYSLQAMVKLGVPQRSLVVQAFLRTCQEKMNEFDEKCLSVLARALEDMDPTCPNVNPLKEGMRLIVDADLPRVKTVLALQNMMRAVGKDAPKDLKKKLERKALSMTDKFSIPNSMHMISTLAVMDLRSKPLLEICSKKIAEDIHGIPFTQVMIVLQACKELGYRNMDLLTAISDSLASKMDVWSTKQAILFLAVFEDLKFCPTAFMEALAERVVANPDALTLQSLLCVLNAYSWLNYDLKTNRQQFLDGLSQVLLSYLSKMSTAELLRAVYSLCLMDHFPPTLLEHLLQSGALEELSPQPSRTKARRFQTVNLCLRLDRPLLPLPLTAPPSVLGDPAPPGLSQALREALGQGADEMLQEAVMVENVYLADGVITKPVPVTKGRIPAGGEYSPAEGSERIAVIYAPQSNFCYGTSHPLGPLAVKIRHLKILGYTPVLVTEQELKTMSQEEMAAVLRRRIFPTEQTQSV